MNGNSGKRPKRERSIKHDAVASTAPVMSEAEPMKLLPVNVGGIPPALKQIDQWVAWRAVLKTKADGTRKIDKVPINPHTGGSASTTDPKTWGTFTQALSRMRSDGLSGVGFVLTLDCGVIGGDIDKCVNPTTGELEPWAAEMAQGIDTYTERSPSGTGVRMFALGKLPPGGRKRGAIEMYDSGRFLTCTGHEITDGEPREVEERTEQFAALHRQVFGESAGDADATLTPEQEAAAVGERRPTEELEAIVEALRANDERFDATWTRTREEFTKGGGVADQSKYDLAIANALVRAGMNDEEVRFLIYCHRREHGEDGDKIKRADYWEKIRDKSRKAAAKAEARRQNGPADAEGLHDIGNGQRLVRAHGQDLRYCHEWGKYLVWDGARLRLDDSGEVMRRCKDVQRRIYTEAAAIKGTDSSAEARRKAIAKHAHASAGRGRLEAMAAMAASEPGIPITVREMDADPWLLNVKNGTIDLRTGELRPHRREDGCTRLAPVVYDRAAKCPLWDAFLRRVMGGNADPERACRLVGFLRRFVGYSLTGSIREHALIFCFGTGANGKSVFLDTVRFILGDYAKPAAPRLLLMKRTEAHPTDIADLHGARFVTAIEADRSGRFDEALLKWLTGGDMRKARRMREDFWEYPPTDKLAIAANHRPRLSSDDPAVWRRFNVVPFDVVIPEGERDKRLPEKLQAEAPGILRWAVEGCLEWQRDGLDAPDEVRAATGAYREAMDTVARFLDECCIEHVSARVKSSDLYTEYTTWCADNGERPLSQRGLAEHLQGKGFERLRNNGFWWLGVGLLSQRQEASNGTNGTNGTTCRVGQLAKTSSWDTSTGGSVGSVGSVDGSPPAEVEVF